jgi:hypothetical protein
MASTEEYAEGMGIEPASVEDEDEDDDDEDKDAVVILASGDDSTPAVRWGCGRLER